MQRPRDARYRPSMMLPLAIGTALLAPIAALLLFAGVGREPAPPLSSAPATVPKTPADRAARAMPPAERSFIAAIDQGKAAYEAGATDAEKAAARASRAGEICRAIPNPHVFAWSGVVDAVSPEAGGAPFVSIEIAPAIRVTTRGDADDAAAAIDPYVLPALAMLQPGQAVVFSGLFLAPRPDGADCYRQASLTAGDAMTAPVFRISLYGIAPFAGASPAQGNK